jgi:hypothetical protein
MSIFKEEKRIAQKAVLLNLNSLSQITVRRFVCLIYNFVGLISVPLTLELFLAARDSLSLSLSPPPPPEYFHLFLSELVSASERYVNVSLTSTSVIYM